jgi:TatD DNase family protein
MIDSHCHLDDYENLAEILANAESAGVHQLLAIGIGDGPDTMHRALEISHQHPQVFATAGIHPQEAHQATPENLAKLAALAEDPRCIAIGEIGLDYYHLTNPDIATQQAALIAQLAIAAAARKPVTIHVRTSELAVPAAQARYGSADAWEDLLTILADHWTLPGIMHCFSGTQSQADRALAAGFYLSFAGNLTYPKSTTIQSVAARAPANRILLETDAPFLTPIPLRGQPNQPAFITHTAAFLAHLRDIPPATLSDQTTKNFHTLFPTTQF